MIFRPSAGNMTEEYQNILSSESVEFIIKLHRNFNNRRIELLAIFSTNHSWWDAIENYIESDRIRIMKRRFDCRWIKDALDISKSHYLYCHFAGTWTVVKIKHHNLLPGTQPHFTTNHGNHERRLQQ